MPRKNSLLQPRTTASAPRTPTIPSYAKRFVKAFARQRRVSQASVVYAALVLGALCPPTKPLPRYIKRTNLPGGDYYDALPVRGTDVLEAAEKLLVPAHFVALGDALTWCLAEYGEADRGLSFLVDYFERADEAADLRAELLRRAAAYTPPAEEDMPPMVHAPPSVPRNQLWRSGPCPACRGKYPACLLCSGTGTIIRPEKMWAALCDCTLDLDGRQRRDGRTQSPGGIRFDRCAYHCNLTTPCEQPTPVLR